jgi:SAM-dependent methyltransferase
MTDNLSPEDVYVDPVISRINFAGKDILEIGCGAGAFTLEHLKQANSILGIDPDNEAIETLKAEWSKQSLDARVDFRQGEGFMFRQGEGFMFRQGEGFMFRQGDVVDFPLPKEAFDIAVFAKSF